eukprot:5242883-Pyramimonas_sp.AAC.1
MALRAYRGPLTLAAASAPGLASLPWHSAQSNLLAVLFGAEVQRAARAPGAAAGGPGAPRPEEGNCP